MQVKTKNLLMGALVVLFVGLAWFQFVYSPMESKASKARSAAHDADQSAAQLRRELATGAQRPPQSEVAATQAMLEAVPVDAAEASFFREVDELRLKSGAAWQSITPTPGTDGLVGSVGLTTVTVGITVQGTNAQLLQYVSGLSDLKRLFVVDNIALTANGSKSGAGSGAPGAAPETDQMQLSVSGRIFSQASAAAAAAGASGSTPSAPVQTGTQTG